MKKLIIEVTFQLSTPGNWTKCMNQLFSDSRHSASWTVVPEQGGSHLRSMTILLESSGAQWCPVVPSDLQHRAGKAEQGILRSWRVCASSAPQNVGVRHVQLPRVPSLEGPRAWVDTLLLRS